jgi:hypothetical protein
VELIQNVRALQELLVRASRARELQLAMASARSKRACDANLSKFMLRELLRATHPRAREPNPSLFLAVWVRAEASSRAALRSLGYRARGIRSARC